LVDDADWKSCGSSLQVAVPFHFSRSGDLPASSQIIVHNSRVRNCLPRMAATMKNKPYYGMEGMDPRLVVPLCIRENRLEEDPALDSDTSYSGTGKELDYGRLLSSPTSIVDLVHSLPEGAQLVIPTSKKKKKSKVKLFRKRRKKLKDEEDQDAGKQEALRLEAFVLKRIREEEDTDFAKLRAEEESSPKLDMLVHYPLTLMEEVLSIPIPEPVGNDENGEDVNEADVTPASVEHQEKPVVNLGRFEEQVHALRPSQMELRHFLSHPTLFAQLQQDLRYEGVITDETLRQKLHFLCRPSEGDDSFDLSNCRDIFSEPAHKERSWGSNLPMAYRRMNESFVEIDWQKETECSAYLRGEMKSKSKWNDRKLHSLRDSYHTEFEDGVDENDMRAYDQGLMDEVDLLTYCVHDLVPIVQEHEVFANLQKELRRLGAVTNEVLKQGLHFYVRDIRIQKQREEAAARATEEKVSSEDLQPGLCHTPTTRTTRSKPLLTKLRFGRG
jgi:hypothetical protein